MKIAGQLAGLYFANIFDKSTIVSIFENISKQLFSKKTKTKKTRVASVSSCLRSSIIDLNIGLMNGQIWLYPSWDGIFPRGETFGLHNLNVSLGQNQKTLSSLW